MISIEKKKIQQIAAISGHPKFNSPCVKNRIRYIKKKIPTAAAWN